MARRKAAPVEPVVFEVHVNGTRVILSEAEALAVSCDEQCESCPLGNNGPGCDAAFLRAARRLIAPLREQVRRERWKRLKVEVI